ncbi:MAG: hypothetical protein AB7P04_08225 [Bacteriovoracia bacterium]
MKNFFFLVIVLGLLGLAAFRWLYSSVEADFEEVHETIAKESLQSARNIAKAGAQNKDSHLVNKNLATPGKTAPTPGLAPGQRHPGSSHLGGESSVPQYVPPPGDTGEEPFSVNDHYGKSYWCRGHIPPTVRGGNKCVYPNACFSCTGSEIIIPEVPDAHPFCNDAEGTLSVAFDLLCCPLGFNDGKLNCPRQAECFQDTDVSSCPMPPEMQSVLDQPNSIYVEQD